VLLQELVEQHRVHRFVADSVRLALPVTSHEIGIHLFHILSHEAELRDALGVNFLLVMEGDWFKREDRFARFVHRLHRLLETRRGNYRAELTVGTYNYPYAVRNGRSTNAGDKGGEVFSYLADADGFELLRKTRGADGDIVIAREVTYTGLKAQCDVVVPDGVVHERTKTDGRAVAVCVVLERAGTDGRVVVAFGVEKERAATDARVAVSGSVAKKRLITVGRVVAASCVVLERLITVGRVEAAGGVVKERIFPLDGVGVC